MGCFASRYGRQASPPARFFQTTRVCVLFPLAGRKSTSQGCLYSIFRRALEHGNLLVAEATAKELPPLNLNNTLDLTI